eukprot:TRINITY_DN767_c0_g1_i3.p2 TRINITY_DN767_c0_g1~~TRINITY_DN767_c0_g1_i3.p2  ORF type:complete len:152 (-),score=16.29 TRINITY_DN767_c0_g1_i3:3422-3877(-)
MLMNSITLPATPAVQPSSECYALHPFRLQRLDREGGRGAWATHGLHTTLFAQDSVTLSLSFSLQALGRWASGDGGRCKMALGAASHEPALRRSRQDGRSPVHLRQGQGVAATLTTEQPSSGTALLPPLGEGSRKGDLKKCLPHLILSAYRS